MKNNIVSILLVILFMSKKEEAPVPIDSNNFENTKKACFRLWVVSDWAANQGYHKLDSVLVISDSVNKKSNWTLRNWIL
jgi:hypothetical protein